MSKEQEQELSENWKLATSIFGCFTDTHKIMCEDQIPVKKKKNYTLQFILEQKSS